MSLIKCYGDFFPRVVTSVISIANYDLLILSCCYSFLQDMSAALLQALAAGHGHMPMATQAAGGIFSAPEHQLCRSICRRNPKAFGIYVSLETLNAECVSFCTVSHELQIKE